MPGAVRTLTRPLGVASPPDYFRFEEHTAFRPERVARVLRGEVAGAMFRGIVDESTCARITSQFWGHPLLSRREDAVPAYFLGTYHYQKTLADYFDAADATRPTLHDIFEGGSNLFDEFMAAVRSVVDPRTVVRVAEHEGRPAGEFVMRSWSGQGAFALLPHDDAAQLSDPHQAGFEIQHLAPGPLIAVNICLENTGGGGQLHYWNVEPTPEARAELGVEVTGYPYPTEVLADHEHLVVPVRRGDVYLFNGRLVHAVQAPDHPGGHRATISFLMGFRGGETLLYWS